MTKRKQRKSPPPGFVKNPKTLQDVIQSLQALGATVVNDPGKRIAKRIRL